jgi:hypothetical protein
MSPRHPIWAYCGLLDLEKTIRRVRASAPSGCSPRGLEEMSYPFKGFESSEWVCLGKTRGHAGQLLLLRFVFRCMGRWGGAQFFMFVGSWVTGAQSVAFSHGSVIMIKWGMNRLREWFTFLRHGMRPTRLP